MPPWTGVTAFPTFHFYISKRKVNELRGADPGALRAAVLKLKPAVELVSCCGRMLCWPTCMPLLAGLIACGLLLQLHVSLGVPSLQALAQPLAEAPLGMLIHGLLDWQGSAHRQARPQLPRQVCIRRVLISVWGVN